MTAEYLIPEMTHPLGRHWRQPERSAIEIFGDNDAENPSTMVATIDERNFSLLSNYTWSIPSGAYSGKMWVAHGRAERTYLLWYSDSMDPDRVMVNKIRLLRRPNNKFQVHIHPIVYR